MGRMVDIMTGGWASTAGSSGMGTVQPIWSKNLIRKLKINKIYAEARKIR